MDGMNHSQMQGRMNRRELLSRSALGIGSLALAAVARDDARSVAAHLEITHAPHDFVRGLFREPALQLEPRGGGGGAQRQGGEDTSGDLGHTSLSGAPRRSRYTW